MSVNDQLRNIKLMLQNDRRVWTIAGFIVVVFVIWTMTTDQRKPRPVAPPETPVQQNFGADEGYPDLIAAMKIQLEQTQVKLDALRQEYERTRLDNQRDKQEITGVFESMVTKIERQDQMIADLENRAEAMKNRDTGGYQPTDISVEPAGLSSFGYEEATVPPPPAPPAPLRMTFISPGDSVSVQLLTGVNAPVDGTPYPVVFKFSGPITGPDGSSLDLGEARLIAAAQGSETDGRVLFRLVDLAIRHPDGRRSVVKVDGWIVGEDGIRGMQGKLIDKLGRLIAATAGVSFAAALGNRIDNQARNLQVNTQGNVEISGNDLDFATSSALTDASNRLGQILLDRYEKLVPVVEILSGREVAAVFSSPAEVTIFEEADDEGIYAAASLD